MSLLPIRTYGDPVLRSRAQDIKEIDDKLVALVDDMIETMYDAPGVGLAAPQVGVDKRLFVYDVGDGPKVLVNPEIKETAGEWVYEEGCLSVPGLWWPITRPKDVFIVGVDLEGNEVELEGTDLLGRVFQHEFDHLEGVLLVERLDEDQRKKAMKVIRNEVVKGGGTMRRPPKEEL
ncbi:peptide deformylase [Ferrithrix thermotolerans DSM 19514]|uniref:Peptide deformylase n=1 Tax=Ferrithrix thermotolerans DSM 19514 TaxID=1121881 RepID=A0A1M4S6J3_9ACTN|nr:peptide deformylase [Ferrithrix thermotolerans]SHE27834.1 peptide deformylase [Ferrithrix thermotolerans DSM 19514]